MSTLRNLFRNLALVPTSPRWIGGLRRLTQYGRSVPNFLDARSVLVVRLDDIGDVVLSSPMLRQLRKSLPDATITLLVRPSVYNLVEHCPYVNRVMGIQVPPMSGASHEWRRHRELRRLVRRLVGAPPDAVVQPRFDFDQSGATLAAFYSGAPRRIGFATNATDAKRRLNRGYDRLFTDVIPANGPMHEMERNLFLLRQLGIDAHDAALELWLSPEDRQTAAGYLPPGESGPSIAICPGANQERRRWPVDRFAQTIRIMQQHLPGLRAIVIGGPGEEPLGQCIQQSMGPSCFNLIGQLSLRQTAAVLERCQLYLGNDTGPMHLAAAAKAKIVMLSCAARDGDPMGNHAPQRFGPWGVPNAVMQPEHATSPCIGSCTASHAHCIAQIEPENVAGEALQLLTAKS